MILLPLCSLRTHTAATARTRFIRPNVFRILFFFIQPPKPRVQQCNQKQKEQLKTKGKRKQDVDYIALPTGPHSAPEISVQKSARFNGPENIYVVGYIADCVASAI